ncbi:Uu.00g098160.m01.CDS01 [Anthostomella pinea]|uniref:Uu.00g098160.m01.CDS01 n=1 Tax=Anthostomella pinea TaxID=933095 RepID=A0AAI8VD84_9PEZI|nr:Uu.00g098160.m01.CDS01 [Anthostomella pinea]
MESQHFKDGRFIPHPDTSDITETEGEYLARHRPRKRRRRDGNVYNAVVGRITTTLPIDDNTPSDHPPPTHHRRHSPSSLRDPTLAPEEVLFAQARAPMRFAEKDIYHAHERLPPSTSASLPDSEILKAVHSYASRFYSELAAGSTGKKFRGRNIDERSMDETALLALGVLLEEAGREVLGKRGDLVFTEGVEVDDEGGLGGEDGDGDGEAVGFKDVLRGRDRGRVGRSRSHQGSTNE